METNFFASKGVHVLADGQFGSCGKGALASWLALQAANESKVFAGTITNAGPNSGHTSYFEGQKIVLKQLPTFAVHSALRGWTHPVYFSAGAIIDLTQLAIECEKFPGIPVFIHPQAAVLQISDRKMEHHIPSIAAVAGTRSGTGYALVRKIQREPNAVYYTFPAKSRKWPMCGEYAPPNKHSYFMEISQGFSLGLNSPFYPKVTSRECTFAQGFADARMPLTSYVRGYLAFRTYPIRVGDVDGYSSGSWYPDQREINWKDIGVEPEITTVTGRVRRIATWSWQQFDDAMNANHPTHVFLNFMNYLGSPQRQDFIGAHTGVRYERLESGHTSYSFIYGFGPYVKDITDDIYPAQLGEILP